MMRIGDRFCNVTSPLCYHFMHWVSVSPTAPRWRAYNALCIPYHSDDCHFRPDTDKYNHTNELHFTSQLTNLVNWRRFSCFTLTIVPRSECYFYSPKEPAILQIRESRLFIRQSVYKFRRRWFYANSFLIWMYNIPLRQSRKINGECKRMEHVSFWFVMQTLIYGSKKMLYSLFYAGTKIGNKCNAS
jgi:hypothetical protein